MRRLMRLKADPIKNELRAHRATTRAVAAEHIERYYDSHTYTVTIYVLAFGERRRGIALTR